MYVGKVVSLDDIIHYVSEFTPGDGTTSKYVVSLVSLNLPADEKITHYQEVFTLPAGVIANHNGDPIETSVGRLIFNYVFSAEPYGDKIPYINEHLRGPSKIETAALRGILNNVITVDQGYRYISNAVFYGHFTELSVPTLSERTLTTSPEVVKRKAELQLQYAEAIKNKDAVAMARIEDELIALDKEWVKGDESASFFDADGKSYTVQRKKMLLTGGMIEDFGSPGQYSFMSNSLEEGWTVADIPMLANEIRKGSYGRAMETADGGEIAKFLLRIFQEVTIVEDDCGTQRTKPIFITKLLKDDYVDRTILVDGQPLVLTPENIDSYVGKLVYMRSPQTCATLTGFCGVCMGEVFRKTGQKRLDLSGQALGSAFLTNSLKGMHGVKVSRTEITDLDAFLI